MVRRYAHSLTSAGVGSLRSSAARWSIFGVDRLAFRIYFVRPSPAPAGCKQPPPFSPEYPQGTGTGGDRSKTENGGGAFAHVNEVVNCITKIQLYHPPQICPSIWGGAFTHVNEVVNCITKIQLYHPPQICPSIWGGQGRADYPPSTILTCTPQGHLPKCACLSPGR